jgi:hypothetical protein
MYPIRKTKRHVLESIDIGLASIGAGVTTITFVRRNFRPDGPTWRIRKFDMGNLTPASLRRLGTALDNVNGKLLTLVMTDVLSICYEIADWQTHRTTRTVFYTFPKEPAP